MRKYFFFIKIFLFIFCHYKKCKKKRLEPDEGKLKSCRIQKKKKKFSKIIIVIPTNCKLLMFLEGVLHTYILCFVSTDPGFVQVVAILFVNFCIFSAQRTFAFPVKLFRLPFLLSIVETRSFTPRSKHFLNIIRIVSCNVKFSSIRIEVSLFYFTDKP